MWLRSHEEDVTIKVKDGEKTKLKVVTITKVCSNTTIGRYMFNIRTIFNVARKIHNRDRLENLTIKHYPFGLGGYEMPEEEEVDPRALEIEDLKRIYNFVPTTKNQRQAIDVFFISLFLMGTNIIDLYYCPTPKNGWLSYHRHKVKNKSLKNSKMVIFMQSELMPYYEKYKGKKTAFDFCERYKSNETFLTAVIDSLKEIGVALDLPGSLTSYYARGSWASIGSNKLHYPDSIIDKGLAHSRGKEHKMLKKYVTNEWAEVNDANKAIIEYYFKETLPETVYDYSI